MPRRRRTGDTHGGIAVVTDDLRRALLPLRDRERRQRHHATARIANVDLQHILDLQAAAILRLHDHALHASSIRVVIDVGRPKIGRDRVIDVRERHTECVGLLAVDDEQNLRGIRQSFHAYACDDLALCSLRHQFSSCLRKRRLSETSTILKTEGEAAGCAEALDWRRRQRKGGRVLQREELHVGTVSDVLHRVALAALRPVLERDECKSRIGAIAREAEALNGHDVGNGRLRLEDRFDLPDGFDRTVCTCFRRSLDVDDQKALVLVGHEGRR